MPKIETTKKKSKRLDIIACTEKDMFGRHEFFIRIPCENQDQLHALQDVLVKMRVNLNV